MYFLIKKSSKTNHVRIVMYVYEHDFALLFIIVSESLCEVCSENFHLLYVSIFTLRVAEIFQQCECTLVKTFFLFSCQFDYFFLHFFQFTGTAVVFLSCIQTLSYWNRDNSAIQHCHPLRKDQSKSMSCRQSIKCMKQH